MTEADGSTPSMEWTSTFGPDDVLRLTQGVITVATTVATPMNVSGGCRTTLVASSQVSGQSWTPSDPHGHLWGA
jgi:hypothetical protein